MSEEENLEAATQEAKEAEAPAPEVKKPKKRGRKPVEKNVITGKVKSDDFSTAVADIEKDSMVTSQQVADILTSTMEQAYLEWSYPGLYKDKDNEDPAKELIKAKVIFNETYTKFDIYDIKTVTPEDDIVDDAYQISLEDAQEIKKDAQYGEEIAIPFDVTKLDKTYVRRVKQLFQSKLKDASRQAILTVYQDQIGELIEGTVTKAENDNYELSFGKAEGFLRKNSRNMLPNDRFVVGERVLVHLSDVSDRSNPPSLVISRTSDKFIMKLLERYVPELQTGIVTIKAIAREAGKRTKIFVESNNPNIDPVGTCVGPESSRIRSALSEIKGEKIDIVKYYPNKALQIIEAMKPATVIGLTCPEEFFDPNVHFDEIENDRDYEYPKITVVVKNGNQGVAIGSQGVNVRLASRITKCTISVLQSDDAISSGLKYMMVADIEKLLASQNKTEVEAPAANEAEETEENVDFDEESVKNEEVVPSVPETKPVTEEAKPVAPAAAEEEKPAEEPTKEEAPAPEEKKEEAQPVEAPAVDAVKEAKQQQQEEKVEHVEIRNKPKISLEELEEALSQKKGPSETRSYRRKPKHEDEKKEEAPSEASKVQAMPIYTEEELREMEEAENENNAPEDEDEDIDLEQYDSDQYYDDEK